MKTEIAIGSTLKEVEKFDKTNMKNVDVQEKNPLPDKEGMLFLDLSEKNCSYITGNFLLYATTRAGLL